MQDKLVNQIMEEVLKEVENSKNNASANNETFSSCGLTEFVGTAIGETIGLVIANVDSAVHEVMNIDKKFRSIGIVSSRTGAGPQILAADEAVKSANVEILSVELSRDTKGGAGHGCLIIFGAEDVSDVRRAIEVTLSELNKTFGDVYANDAGHIELQYTARASFACNKAFNAPIGKAFGLMVGAPAGIGIVMADTAVKAANVEVLGYASPAHGTSFSNEVILFICGDSGAVRQAIIAAREVGVTLLETLGNAKAESITTPYI